jgi:putative endonuclease
LINDAKAREKTLKNWHREWKVNLIKGKNPELRDLSAQVQMLKQVQHPPIES